MKPSDISTEQDRQGNEVTDFRLPRTKSAPQGESIYWARQDGPSDPRVALDNHFLINAPPPDGPLFAYRRAKTHVPLTKSKFLAILTSSLKEAGQPPLLGHGIRIGSTLECLLRNAREMGE